VRATPCGGARRFRGRRGRPLCALRGSAAPSLRAERGASAAVLSPSFSGCLFSFFRLIVVGVSRVLLFYRWPPRPELPPWRRLVLLNPFLGPAPCDGVVWGGGSVHPPLQGAPLASPPSPLPLCSSAPLGCAWWCSAPLLPPPLPPALRSPPFGLPGPSLRLRCLGGLGLVGDSPRLRTGFGGAPCSLTRFKSLRPLVCVLWCSDPPPSRGPLGGPYSPAGWAAAPPSPRVLPVGLPGYPSPIVPWGDPGWWGIPRACAPASVAPRAHLPVLRACAPWFACYGARGSLPPGDLRGPLTPRPVRLPPSHPSSLICGWP